MEQHLLITVPKVNKLTEGIQLSVVVDEKFVLRIPENLEAATAPLLCRSYYIPLRHWNVKKGDKVGVVGLGGLGHMGVNLLMH
jgi:uncharacterized zinc-type alcohol dehydrogenase-like protein